MEDSSIERVLQKYFSQSSRADWEKVAMRETGSEDPFGDLSWRGSDGIAFSPYYDHEDVAGLPIAKHSPQPAARNWENLPAVDVHDERTANSAALDHLANGGDGILFDLRATSATNLDLLLKGIEWPFCMLAFDVNARSGIPKILPTFFENRNLDPALVKGALFWESIPEKGLLSYCIQNCKQLYSAGLIVPAGSPTQEISTALAEGVKILNAFTSDQADVLHSISFSLQASASLPETTAKIKALRLLWMSVAHAYGYNDYKATDLYIHARSVSVADDGYGPHENMLKGSFAAIGAVLGGCNGLTLMAADQPYVSRWARNVSLILREESFFSEVADPLAGSYAFDTFVDAIARGAWRIFQEKSRTL